MDDDIRRRIDQLAGEFRQLEDDFLRYSSLVELGGLLPFLSTEERAAADLFPGCQSRVWLHMELRGGRFHLCADSDTVILRGLLYVLVTVYDGAPPEEAAGAAFSPLEELGLSGSFSPQRQGGIAGILEAIRGFCRNAPVQK